MMNDIENLTLSLHEYLGNYSWIFNYSNVKIMQEKHKWPSEWSDFIHHTSVLDLKQIFKSEASNCPYFVKDFVKKRNSLLNEFETIFISDTKNPVTELGKEKEQQIIWNQLKRGMNIKKQHEVLMFGPIIEEANKSFEGLDHIVDVGSGAGHLERYLLKMTSIKQNQFVCIESSNSHVESSIKQTRNDEELKVATINATVKNSEDCHKDLDFQIESCSSKSISNKSALIGLHACGDLTNSMISWFHNSKFGLLAVVSCCYHKMTTFPVSQKLKSSVKEDLRSHFALRLACQGWYFMFRNLI